MSTEYGDAHFENAIRLHYSVDFLTENRNLGYASTAAENACLQETIPLLGTTHVRINLAILR